MFTVRGRIACGTLALAIAAALLATGEPFGWLFVGQVLLLAYGYVRYGPMVIAFRAYHERDWSRLESLLAEVRRPEWLRPQDRAYFDFLRGVTARVRGDVAAARQHLAAVDPSRLRSDHIRCVLECHRAGVALESGDRAAAAAHLQDAIALPHRAEADGEITRLQSLVVDA